MSNVIKLVQGDTRPDLIVTLTDSNANHTPIPLDGATVRMRFREMDTTDVVDTLIAIILDGASGLVKFTWGDNTLQNAGVFEGEIEITFSDGRIQSPYDLIYFDVREQF